MVPNALNINISTILKYGGSEVRAHLPSAGPSSHSEQSYSIGGGAIGRPIRPIIRLRDRLLKPNVAAAPS